MSKPSPASRMPSLAQSGGIIDGEEARLTQSVAAGQAAVQGLGVDVQGSVELLAVSLTTPL
jgi:hypothetical protein